MSRPEVMLARLLHHCCGGDQMKVAIAVWEDRVSSVLDFSQRLVVVELKNGGETSRAQIALSESNAFAKLARLRELGINVLICGAISQLMASATMACNIQLLPYVTGRVDDVLKAYQTGQLGLPQFMLPGWWPGARRGFRRRCCRRDGRRRAGQQAQSLDHRRQGTADGDGV
jgi:predicted Fe-Mo cluster-binding NifX family protein